MQGETRGGLLCVCVCVVYKKARGWQLSVQTDSVCVAVYVCARVKALVTALHKPAAYNLQPL